MVVPVKIISEPALLPIQFAPATLKVLVLSREPFLCNRSFTAGRPGIFLRIKEASGLLLNVVHLQLKVMHLKEEVFKLTLKRLDLIFDEPSHLIFERVDCLPLKCANFSAGLHY